MLQLLPCLIDCKRYNIRIVQNLNSVRTNRSKKLLFRRLALAQYLAIRFPAIPTMPYLDLDAFGAAIGIRLSVKPALTHCSTPTVRARKDQPRTINHSLLSPFNIWCPAWMISSEYMHIIRDLRDLNFKRTGLLQKQLCERITAVFRLLPRHTGTIPRLSA